MSGGSLNHLGDQEQPRREDLEAAIGALENLIIAGPDVAGELQPLLQARTRTREVLEAIPAPDDPIRDVWRSLDRHGSGDVGSDAIAAALRAYPARVRAHRDRARR